MNTRYYLDTEFNSFGGSLLSLGIVRHDDPDDHLYLVVPNLDIERIRAEEGMDPWIEENVIKNLYCLPPDAHFITAPSYQWGAHLSDFIYRGSEITQVMVDWPSDAMDFCKLLMTGPGQAVPMLNQTHVTILRHIDVYPTTLPDAIQHNALWDAMAIRQLLVELEEQKEKPIPKSAIEKLGLPMNHDSETQAAIERLGDEFHKTRISQNVCVDPGDLSLALKALGYYG